jgi:uncharacterized protein YgiM (DUF1202 family)
MKKVVMILGGLLLVAIFIGTLSKKEKPNPPTQTTQRTEALYTLICPKDGINIRTGPGTDFPKDELGPLSKGDTLYVLSYYTGWVKFRVTPHDEGWSGWVLKRLVAKVEQKTQKRKESRAPEIKKSKATLKFDVIKTSGLGKTMVEVQVKITNNTAKHIHNAQVTCILSNSNRREIAFQRHYAIKSTEGGLAPHRSTYFTYIVDCNYSQVHYVSFQIEELNFK